MASLSEQAEESLADSAKSFDEQVQELLERRKLELQTRRGDWLSLIKGNSTGSDKHTMKQLVMKVGFYSKRSLSLPSVCRVHWTAYRSTSWQACMLQTCNCNSFLDQSWSIAKRRNCRKQLQGVKLHMKAQ